MDYSNVFFNKSLQSLQFRDIEDYFISPKEENTRIEFKSFSERTNFEDSLPGIVRGICAFLNSEGGILVWGAPKGEKQSNGSKIFCGSLNPLPLCELKEKDRLINKISDLITPLPLGIEVAILTDEKSVIYIFEIQKSDYSPHQFNNVYYARLDGQSRPAPHYLVDSLFKKIKYPNIEGYIRLDKFYIESSSYCLDLTIAIFNFSPLQNEENISLRLMSPAGVFKRSGYDAINYDFDGHELVMDNFATVLHFGGPHIHSETIVFNPHQLLSNFQNKAILILAFGGKYSPLKTSTYIIDFKKLDYNKVVYPNYLFSEIKENKLSIDDQIEKGTTRENTLKSFLEGD